MQSPAIDIYIASPLFSSAERAFNERLAELLRAAGCSVFLPQELSSNHVTTPTEREIFVGDTIKLLQSRLLLAVIDGETTDAGVATEIGVAVAHGTPIVGLWTDIRQRRIGSGRMYRNIYMTGAIQQNGTVVNSVDDAVSCSLMFLETHPLDFDREVPLVIASFAARKVELERAKEVLLRGYQAPFDGSGLTADLIAKHVSTGNPSVLDFGSGDAKLGESLASRLPAATYTLYDTSSNTISVDRPPYRAFDAIALSFVLHDYMDKRRLVSSLRSRLATGGRLVILDLERSDLLHLCSNFEQAGLRFRSTRTDTRLSAGELHALASETGMEIVELGIVSVPFKFLSESDLSNYVTAYSIDSGFDLGLPRQYGGDLAQDLMSVIRSLHYPFSDTRVFIFAVLRSSS